MKKETKKAVETTAKETDVITNDKTDTFNIAVADGKATEAKPAAETNAVLKAKVEPVQRAKSLIIKLEDLVPFKDHPYKVIENESMNELTESIAANGLLNPLLVRPLEGSEGRYEIISGHRRYAAAQKLWMKKVPCTVHFIDRDAATVMMVDSNCQRTELLPSEKAKAYKMKMDAIKRMPGRKSAENGDPVGPHLKSTEKLAEESDDSPTQIKRFIRLTYLVPELLQYVDEGKIGMRPAVEMSYLDEDTQRDIVDRIIESNDTVFPSHAQTRVIRKLAESGGISYEKVKEIMDEPKPNQAEKLKIPTEELRSRIGKSMTDEQFIKYLYTAVDYYKKYLERQRDMGAR